MNEGTPPELFDETIDLPNGRATERLVELVGLDEAADALRKELLLVIQRDALESWSKKAHGAVLPAVVAIARRSPLVVLAGDVGCGKTSLAETFADPLARDRGVRVHVLRMSLRVRGRGAVGEMTNLITSAFEEVVHVASGFRGAGAARGAVVLIIDEADALAQSRELADMHHEDRAGVNALIRGIGQLAERQLPAMVVLCTNRLDVLDPALRRRAAREIPFSRPDEEQRLAVLKADLAGARITNEQLREIAQLTGPRDGETVAFTFSDLRERLVPAAILSVYPDGALTFEVLAATARALRATPAMSPPTER